MDDAWQDMQHIGFWAVFAMTVGLLFVAGWYVYMCRIAHRPFRWVSFIPVICLVPSFLVGPVLLFAALAALMTRKVPFYTAFRYYNVALIFGSAHATRLYGPQRTAPGAWLARRFAALRRRNAKVV